MFRSLFDAGKTPKQEPIYKQDICPFISCSVIKIPEDFMLTSSKVLAEEINVRAIRFYITFRLSKLKNRGSTAFYYYVLNFFSNFANISEAQIYFTEFDIKNAY
mmetsp:Transcript_33529/g.32599  ORF Transcript_33529/g.32599 Transcript_33529/m.32599 type:complete len:104 (-) Transcript_33529:1150-1461(-)